MLPGTIRSAPLCPIRLSADTVDTSMSSDCRRPARVSGCSRRPAARARAAGDAVDDLEALLHPVAGGLLHPRPRGVDDREHLLVGDVAGAPPRVDPGLEAALGLPQVADPGDDPLVEQGVADRARRVVGAQPPQDRPLVELGGEDVRAEPGDPLVEARARESVISSSTGPLIWATSLSPLRITSHVLRGGRPVGVAHPPLAGHAQVRVDRQPALEAQEQVLAVRVDAGTARPSSRSGQRSRPKRGCGVAI